VQPLRVTFVNTDDAPRRVLEERIRRLGHDVLAAEAGGGGGPSPAGDVVVADLRGADTAVRRDVWPDDDGRPILALVDETALPDALLGRRSGVVVSVGAGGETVLEVGLRVCAALRRGEPAGGGGRDASRRP
jgi:hypothetical protein